MAGLNNRGYNVSPDNRACHGAIAIDVTKGQTTMVDPIGTVCPEGFPIEERIVPVDVPPAPQPAPGPAPQRCRRTRAPQINAVDEDTDLVLFTIGGNDLGFRPIVEQCFGWYSPIACQDGIKKAVAVMEGHTMVEPAEPGKAYWFRDELRAMLDAVESRGRDDLKVVFLSYPFLEVNAHLKVGGYDVGAELRKQQKRLDEIQYESFRRPIRTRSKPASAPRVGMPAWPPPVPSSSTR